jgi:uncharacterized phosphosugar-binding protein
VIIAGWAEVPPAPRSRRRSRRPGLLADQIAADTCSGQAVGHSGLPARAVFFRAGGLMHINATLDKGTPLCNGALRSMAIERIPGYGRSWCATVTWARVIC